MNCEVKETLCVLSDGYRGWTKELNVVSWNGGGEKLDIREWSSDHEKCTKGITLTREEAEKLRDALTEWL